jgi:hypothetical protein
MGGFECLHFIDTWSDGSHGIGWGQVPGNNATSWAFSIYCKKHEAVYPSLEVLDERSLCNHEEVVAFQCLFHFSFLVQAFHGVAKCFEVIDDFPTFYVLCI